MREFTILVLGGYGNFGKRICERLLRGVADDHRVQKINLIIAGRNIYKAQYLRDRLLGEYANVKVSAQFADIQSLTLEDTIKESGANLVIHAAGPFQGQDYRVARATINAGAHYLDLADDHQFVLGIGELAYAEHHGVAVVTGASTVPALSAAVLDQLICEFKTLDVIEYGITPGYRAERGDATVAGIVSYLGHPFTCWRNGDWSKAYSWQELRRYDYNKALGFKKLGKRSLANVDIPDLELFPERYAGVNTVKFGAGVELRGLHYLLCLMSWLSRLRLIWSWGFCASVINRISHWFDWMGSDVGGMFIQVSGSGFDDQPKTVRWILAAGSGHGPYIPTIPAVLVARKLLHGEYIASGAQQCMGMISLDEFLHEVKDLDIQAELQTS